MPYILNIQPQHLAHQLKNGCKFVKIMILKLKTSTICCYPTNKNFIDAHSKNEIIKKIKNLKILN